MFRRSIVRARWGACAVLSLAFAEAGIAQTASAPASLPELYITTFRTSGVLLPDAAPALSLDDAFRRVADAHPDLRLFDARAFTLDAERDRALLRPGWTAGAELENALGTGDASGLHSADLTLSLATVLERGGKRDARARVAQTRIDALAMEREARRLDLLAETARRYVELVGAHQQRTIALLDIEQRTRTVAAARRRMEAGASPASAMLTAQAALARAELDRDRAAQRCASARLHLAALWGERAPAFDVAAADVLALPPIDDAAVLADLLERTPELQQFAGEQRIREARLQLARSEATPDVSWSVGMRRIGAGDDYGLVGAVTLPLGSRDRAQPGIAVAERELAAIGIERESRSAALYATLAEAHGRYSVARLEVQRLGNDVLPKLADADAAAQRAYEAGAISYLEWAQVQSERTAVRRQQLDVALDAQRALIELQRLTGESFVADAQSQNQDIRP